MSVQLTNIDGLAIDGEGGLYMSAAAAVALGGQSMTPSDIIRHYSTATHLIPGETTSCGSIDRFWQATAKGFAATAKVKR